jgi:hypothetical protein
MLRINKISVLATFQRSLYSKRYDVAKDINEQQKKEVNVLDGVKESWHDPSKSTPKARTHFESDLNKNTKDKFHLPSKQNQSSNDE